MSGRLGFTLIEVVVALAIGALVLLGARAILEQLGDAADRTADVARAADRAANTEAAVRMLALRMVAPSDTHPLLGSARVARFTSWCDVPGGWLERCRVAIGVVPTALADSVVADSLSLDRVLAMPGRVPSSVAVIVRTSTGDVFRFRTGVARAALRYLTDAARGGHWSPAWGGGVQAPLAIGVITEEALRLDTIVLRIGERR